MSNDFVWQLLRGHEKLKRVDSAEQYKFWRKYVDYLETMARQNGASEEMIACAKRGDGFKLQALAGGK